MGKITVTLTDEERRALITLGQIERRDPRDQAAIILRRELERLGIIAPPTTSTQTKRSEVAYAATAAA